MALGENIKKLRKEKKITQQKLAKDIGVSRSYLSDLENNRYNPSIKTIEMLADKLNVTVFYLTTGKKMMGDLSDEDMEGFVRNIGNSIRRNKENSKEYVKNELDIILNSELDLAQTMYLVNMVNFLKYSDGDDVMTMASIVRVLNSGNDNAAEELNATEGEFKAYLDGEEPEEIPVTQEEIKEYIDGEMEGIRKLFEKRFNYKGGE